MIGLKSLKRFESLKGPEKMEWLKQRKAHVGYKKCRRLVWLSWQTKVSTEHQLNHILAQESRKEREKKPTYSATKSPQPLPLPIYAKPLICLLLR